MLFFSFYFLSYILSHNNARSRNMKCTIQNRTVLFNKDKAEESSVLFLTDWSAWPKWTKVWSATTPLRARLALETFFYAVTNDSLLSALVWWSRHHPIPLQTLSVQDSVRLKKKKKSTALFWEENIHGCTQNLTLHLLSEYLYDGKKYVMFKVLICVNM